FCCLSMRDYVEPYAINRLCLSMRNVRDYYPPKDYHRVATTVYSVAKWRMRDVRDYHRVATDRVVRMRDYHPVEAFVAVGTGNVFPKESVLKPEVVTLLCLIRTFTF